MATPPGVVIVKARTRNGARAAVAAGVGVLLVALVALVYIGNGSHGSLAQSGEDEKPTAKAVDSKHGSKAMTKFLAGNELRHARSEIQALKKEIQSEQARASKLDQTVAEEEKSIKQVVLKAKKMEEEAIKADSDASAKTKQAAAMKKKSVDLRKESKIAKQKFVAEEKPLETASKLSAHDQNTYRKAELEVAGAVTEMSEKPSDAKLARKVHKLVEAAQKDRSHMEKDHQMLTSLERNIASVQVGKAGSYSALLGDSVALKKKAGLVAQTAQSLADEAARLHKEASADVDKATTEQAGPDKLHGEAHALRVKYDGKLATMTRLEKELQQAPRKAPVKRGHALEHNGLKREEASKSVGKLDKASSRLDAGDSKGKARQQFLAGLFSRSWNKVAPGQDRASQSQ